MNKLNLKPSQISTFIRCLYKTLLKLGGKSLETLSYSNLLYYTTESAQVKLNGEVLGILEIGVMFDKITKTTIPVLKIHDTTQELEESLAIKREALSATVEVVNQRQLLGILNSIYSADTGLNIEALLNTANYTPIMALAELIANELSVIINDITMTSQRGENVQQYINETYHTVGNLLKEGRKYRSDSLFVLYQIDCFDATLDYDIKIVVDEPLFKAVKNDRLYI